MGLQGAGHALSLLQHIRHTQPGSPFRPTRTDKLLLERQLQSKGRGRLAYTMLLARVQMQPMNVLVAMVLSLRLPGARSKFL